MLDIQQKCKVRSVMYSRVTLGILSVIMLLVLHSTYSVYKKKVESESLKNISENNVLLLRDRNTDLEARIARLSTEPGLEEEIRSKFSVAKENENMVIIVPDDSVASSAPVSKPGFFGRIKNFFTR